MYNSSNRAVSIDSVKPLLSSQTLLYWPCVDLGGGTDVRAGALKVGPLPLNWLLLEVLPAVYLLVICLSNASLITAGLGVAVG